MKVYEQLSGEAGPRSVYRPERFDAHDAFPTRSPRVKINDDEFRLQDISLSGLAFLADYTADLDPRIDALIPFKLSQNGSTLFAGEGRVVRVEETAFGAKVAFHLVSKHFELKTLRSKNANALLREDFLHASRQAFEALPRDYRSLCADVLQLVRSHRAILEQGEEMAHASGAPEEIDDLLTECEARILPQWRSYVRDGNRLAGPLLKDKAVLRTAKRYTEALLTAEFRPGPFWDRSYIKPLGYPGDFEIMNFLYDWRREGATPYAKLLHRLGLDAAECVRTRMLVVKDMIGEVALNRAGQDETRIISLGCGSAREVELYLQDAAAGASPVRFTLIDQERRALDHAYAAAYPLSIRRGANARVDCLNLSFMQILRDAASLAHLPMQHMIYTVGLIDYLSPKLASSLIAKLYEKLAPGGLLFVGNMSESVSNYLWPTEFITDWRLHYRNEKDMRNLASGLPTDMVWTKTEQTGNVYLMFISKPGDCSSTVLPSASETRAGD